MKYAFRPYQVPGHQAAAVEWHEPNKWFEDRTVDLLRTHLEHEYMWVHDTDSSGENTEFVGIRDDAGGYLYFKVDHSWYWMNWNSDSRYVQNDFTWTEISKEEAQIPNERDWLDLRPRSHPENIGWPRQFL